MKKLFFVLLFALTFQVQASTLTTVFTPSDGDVDIINLELFGGGFNPGQFAALTRPLDLIGGFPIHSVFPLNFAGGNAVHVTTEQLVNEEQLGSFSVAVFDGFDWHYEDAVIPLSNLDGAILNYQWDYGAVTFDHLDLAVVDASVVPVPAAAWLFGSGLLGLVGVGRNRKPLA